MGTIKKSWVNSGMSGRPDKESKVYARTNHITGKVESVELKHPYDGGHNEQQVANRARFKAVTLAVGAWTRKGKELHAKYLASPSELTPEEHYHVVRYIEVRQMLEMQHEQGSIYAYLAKKMADGRTRAEVLGILEIPK